MLTAPTPLTVSRTCFTWSSASFTPRFLPTAQVDALGAAGGVILLGLGFRLAGIKQIPVGDLLPALVMAPLIVAGIGLFR